MDYLIFEDSSRVDLQPLTFTRPVWDLRVGIARLHEKWAHFLRKSPDTIATGYLGPRFNKFQASRAYLALNGKFLPDAPYVQAITQGLAPGEYLVHKGEVLAFHGSLERILQSAWAQLQSGLQAAGTTLSAPALEALGADSLLPTAIGPELLQAAGFHERAFAGQVPEAIRFPWDIFRLNGAAIRADFAWLGAVVGNTPIADPHTAVYGRDNIFAAPDVQVRAAILNAEDGPIYLGPGVQVQEGAIIHGAHAILDHATINMGAKLRGDSTIGPWSKVGGEVANSVVWGYSSKGHEGYMGNSVLGQWCNLGADTNTSNLKNNYADVKVWNYRKGGFLSTGLQFCGLIMGDHSKCGINTMFNTGTVVGVSANVFGAGYPRNFLPSFAWGGSSGYSTYRLRKVYETAALVMERRGKVLDDTEKGILEAVFELTKPYRNWDR